MLEAEATRCMTQGRAHLGLSLFCSPKVNKKKAKDGRGSSCQQRKRKDMNYI